eukprot:2509688-Prymnesium_polylepis.1
MRPCRADAGRPLQPPRSGTQAPPGPPNKTHCAAATHATHARYPQPQGTTHNRTTCLPARGGSSNCRNSDTSGRSPGIPATTSGRSPGGTTCFDGGAVRRGGCRPLGTRPAVSASP